MLLPLVNERGQRDGSGGDNWLRYTSKGEIQWMATLRPIEAGEGAVEKQ